MESNQAVLQNIIGLYPAAQAGSAAKHLPGELEEPAAGMVKQRLLGCRIPCQRIVEKCLQTSV